MKRLNRAIRNLLGDRSSISSAASDDRSSHEFIKANHLTQPSTTTATQHTPPARRYRHIPIGSGRTYALSRETPHIGTTHCLNSVGVFFQLADRRRCFAAHIDVCIEQADGRRGYETNILTTPLVREQIMLRLDAVREKEAWGEIGTGEMCESLVVVCARMYGHSTQMAEVVAKAVVEWVGKERKDGERWAEGFAGFVVSWPEGGKVFLDGAPSERLWEPVEEPANGEWEFTVEDHGLVASDEAW